MTKLKKKRIIVNPYFKIFRPSKNPTKGYICSKSKQFECTIILKPRMNNQQQLCLTRLKPLRAQVDIAHDIGHLRISLHSP